MSAAPPPLRRFIVVSDFHMSEGRDEHDRPSRCEAFWQDDVFADFLEFIAQRAERTGEACTLLLFGDFLDFLHTRRRPAGTKRPGGNRWLRSTALREAIERCFRAE
ncbi:MAG: hypothetical protein ABIR67_08520 [Gaiellaceae bacterium]